MRTWIVTVAALALAMGGCRASASANVNTGKKADDDTETGDESGPVEPGDAEPASPADYALLGARHDLRLAANKTPNCSCLAVAVGVPGDASFGWDGPAPAIDPQQQLVIALSSEGISCAGAKPGNIGASYWGYRQNGDDVIVIVENSRAGRPVTSGAIIPKPYGAGQVYVKAASKNVPYGHPLVAGDKLCKVGNPGPARGAEKPAPPEEENND